MVSKFIQKLSYQLKYIKFDGRYYKLRKQHGVQHSMGAFELLHHDAILPDIRVLRHQLLCLILEKRESVRYWFHVDERFRKLG